MRRWTVQPTRADELVARAAVAIASPAEERSAKAVTLLGDERLLLAAFGFFWLGCMRSRSPHLEAASRLLIGAVITTVLPHLVKGVIAQQRPDRCEVHGNRRGIPHSGQAFDAFPSGHAMHMGAAGSALAAIAPAWRLASWSLCAVVAASRVVVLAHWLTDVLVGFGVGVAVDKLLARPLAARGAASVHLDSSLNRGAHEGARQASRS